MNSARKYRTLLIAALIFNFISGPALASEMNSSSVTNLSSCKNDRTNNKLMSSCERIAFTRYELFQPNIYIMTSEGTNQRKIITNGYSPRLSPQGNKILFLRNVYYSEVGQTGIDIFVANSDGTNIYQLTKGGNLNLSPSWSPNGKQIVFTSGWDITGESGVGKPFDIFVMNLDGSNITQLTNTPNFERDVSWSPDGRKIAFMRDLGNTANGPFNIFVMNSDGSNQINISNNGCSDFHPDWSPLGKKIVFVSNCEGYSASVTHMPEIYVMNTDGSVRTRLTSLSIEGSSIASFAYYPTWSPDGTRISFTAVPLDPNNGDWEIYVIDSDGKNMRNLTNNIHQDQESTWSK